MKDPDSGKKMNLEIEQVDEDKTPKRGLLVK